MATKDVGTQPSHDDHLINKQVTRAIYSQCKNGEWTTGPTCGQTAASFVSGDMYCTLFVPARDCSVDQIGVNVTSSGFSSNLRLGIYELTIASDGGMTTSLIVNGGTVSSGTTGVKTVSFTAVNLKYGKHYLVGVVWTGGGSTPQIRFVAGPLGLGSISDPTTTVALDASFGEAYWLTGVGTGALPSNPSVNVSAGLGPLIAIHCSA